MKIAGNWVPCPWHTSYMVSEKGVVIKIINARHPYRRQWREIKPMVDKDGYLRVCIAGRKMHVHRLVFWAHKEPLIKGMVICHLDGDKRNNRPLNLAQVVQRENIQHKLSHGTWQAGNSHPRTKYPDSVVESVRHFIDTSGGYRGVLKDAATLFGLPETFVHDIARGKRNTYEDRVCDFN
jgi:hypothetical protein